MTSTARSDDLDIHGNDPEALKRVHEHDAKLEMTLGNYHVGGLMKDGEPDTHANGYRLGRGFVGGGDGPSAEENRRRKESAYRQALKSLQDQIDRLNEEIKALKAQIAVLDRELSEIDEAMKAIREGRDLPENEAARRLKEEYRRRTGKEYDPNDAAAQAFLLQIAQEQRDSKQDQRDDLQDQLDQKITQRDEAQEKLDRGREVEQELDVAIARGAELAELEEVIETSSAVDVRTAIARSDSDELTRQGHEALDLTEDQTEERLEMEDIASTDDLSFMMGGMAPPMQTASAAAGIDGATPINEGENVQPAFARAVAGESLPPGVEPPAADEEQQVAMEGVSGLQGVTHQAV